MNADIEPSDVESIPSLNTTESVIAGLWKEVLEPSAAISATDNFFQLGGDSIGMVTVLFRIQEEFSVELPPEAMLTAPTIRELATLVSVVSTESHIPVV